MKDKKDKNLENSWFATENVPVVKKAKNKKKPKKRFYFNFAFFKRNKKTKKPTRDSNSKIRKFLGASSNIIVSASKTIYSPIKKGKQIIGKKPMYGKIFFTFLLIVIFRLAASITTPGVEVSDQFGSDPSSFVGIMDMMGGGALKQFSIVALGISPYITASIIMTLLQSEVFPPLYRLSRSGPAGKKKLNIITRIITLIFALIQAITIIQQLSGGSNAMVSLKPPFNTSIYRYFALPIILIAGSMFTLFLGEQITNKGVGNGTSLIIFSGIVVNLPSKFKNAFNQLISSNSTQSSFVGMMNFLLYIIVFLVILYIIGYLYKAERHVPIQQTGSGMTKEGSKISHLPIKINPAGVMPIIFALSISILPITVAQFMDHQNEARIWMENNLRLTAPIGLLMLMALTSLFTVAMSIITFNPYNVAESFKKNGTFIPGIKPGDQTEKYLVGIIIRLSIFSAVYLSAITAIQYIEEIIGMDQTMTFGGTSMIILVTVSIETLSQLKARDKTSKISKAKQKSMVTSSNKTGGLLW